MHLKQKIQTQHIFFLGCFYLMRMMEVTTFPYSKPTCLKSQGQNKSFDLCCKPSHLHSMAFKIIHRLTSSVLGAYKIKTFRSGQKLFNILRHTDQVFNDF